MAGGREVVVVMVAAACLPAAAAAAAAAWREEDRLRVRPCPSAEDIHPCVCTVNSFYGLDMDCSNVQSSHELANAFNAQFPFLGFCRLFIQNNQHITDLRVGDLGDVTFEEIRIDNGVLETVDPGALAHSYNTLVVLSMMNNYVFQFPFDELAYFTELTYFFAHSNDFRDFPQIYSKTLKFTVFEDNPLGRLTSTALQDLPKLKFVSFPSCGLTQVDPGTFVGLKKLRYISLMHNDLTILRENTVEFRQAKTKTTLNLKGNQLTTVEPNAIKVHGNETYGLTKIAIDDNQLRELNEDVWRPLLDHGLRVSASGNPLTCGCDVAWIVLNPDYLNLFNNNLACADGMLVSDLDPAFFEANCT